MRSRDTITGDVTSRHRHAFDPPVGLGLLEFLEGTISRRFSKPIRARANSAVESAGRY
jgi:hypothetical protein